MKSKFRKTVVAGAISGLFGLPASGVNAAGFALIEQNASGMGNAYAGAAAVADDASTVFFNPAGMSLLDRPQFAVAGHVISVSSEFTGTGTNPAALGGGAASGGNGGDAGDTAIVPNGYYVMPVGEQVRFGVGINVPFGLATEYDSNWIGRFQGVKSELTTVNINPSVSYKLSDAVSIGGGISYQMADVELTNAVVLGAGVTGKTKLEADDDGWGWNLGAMFQLSQSTRVGVSYRSEIEYELEGNVTTTADPTNATVTAASGGSRAEATFPDMWSVSVAHSVNDRLELLADMTRTGWSSLGEVRVVNTTNGTLRDVLDFDFDDAMRYSAGVNYQLNDRWVVRGGIAFDETPVKGATSMTVRLPDGDRTWISIGGQLMLGQMAALDFGFTHLMIDDANIDFTRSQQAPGQTVPTASPGTATTVTGTYDASVNIISVQYSMRY